MLPGWGRLRYDRSYLEVTSMIPSRATPAVTIVTVVLGLAGLAVHPASAQTKIEPRWNRFSEQDDVEIGKKSAVEAEKKLKLVSDATVLAYVREIGGRLIARSRGPSFPYTFKVVDDKVLNAFALPGGPIYLNRGVLEA